MRVIGWACVGAAVLFGCGGSSGGSGSTTSQNHALAIHFAGDGSGQVHSGSPAFDCNGSCTQNLLAGSSIQLTAAPAAGSSFAGWQGACSGTGSCTLTLDMDRDVTASFSALPAGSARVTVNPAGKGAGRVTSTPTGIDCPGTCSMTVSSGASVSLTAQPDAASNFMGWGGACSGPAACSLDANGDMTVWVDFEAKTPPSSASCAGIPAPATPVMSSYVYQPNTLPASCGGAAGDASGTLALDVNGAHGDAVYLVGSTGKLLSSNGTSMDGFPLQQPKGLSVVSGRPYLGPDWAIQFGQMLSNFDSTGKATGVKFFANHSGQKNLPAEADPNGGVLFAGDLAMGPSDPTVHAVLMFEGGGTSGAVRWGPNSLASSGAVFGLGVDVLGRSLVITDGAPKFGAGNISAQWFNTDGTALTGEFLLLSKFSSGSATWFETTALIGGGVLVRRMDAGPHAQALVTVASGFTSPQPAPDWMMARADTRLQIARGGRAYAVLPYGAKNVPCSERVEVVPPDGTSCGMTDYPIASGSCDTRGLTLGADGTVIQQLPDSMETTNPILATHTCTWRWWPAAAK